VAWALSGGGQATFVSSEQEWNAAHSDQKITTQYFQNDPYKQKLRTAIGAGEGPTLFENWGGGILKSYVDNGKIADLTADLQKNPAWKDQFFPSVLKSTTFDGKIYGTPINGVAPVVLFYNKKLFAEAGVSAPTTWTQLLSAVRAFKAKGIIPIALGGASKWTDLMWLEYLVDRIGGSDVFANIAAGKANAWSQPAVLQATQMIQQLVDAGGFGTSFASVSYDTGQADALLYTGKSAMELMGTWAYPSMQTAVPSFISSGSLGWTTFPTVDGGAGSPSAVVGNPSNFFSITASASNANKANALAYLEKGIYSDSYVQNLIKGGDIPPIKGLEATIAKSDKADWLGFIYQLTQKATTFQLSYDQALQPAAADTLLTNLDQLFLKQITPQQFSDNMNKTLS
jgi:raffinose/stachyose/melibiose transport system substrate-binding protein